MPSRNDSASRLAALSAISQTAMRGRTAIRRTPPLSQDVDRMRNLSLEPRPRAADHLPTQTPVTVRHLAMGPQSDHLRYVRHRAAVFMTPCLFPASHRGRSGSVTGQSPLSDVRCDQLSRPGNRSLRCLLLLAGGNKRTASRLAVTTLRRLATDITIGVLRASSSDVAH